MTILAFDTCFDACSVALLPGGNGPIVSRFEAMSTGHAERLVPMIGEVVEQSGLAFERIDRIAVTVGPGTFTGTRIGVAAARALALALDRPVVAETSLSVMAEELADEFAAGAAPAEQEILIAMDARRDEVYCQLFRGREALTVPAVLPPRTAAALGQAEIALTAAGSAAEAIAAAARELGRPVQAMRGDLLPSALYLAKRAALRPAGTDAVAPLYLRPADAKPQIGKSIPRTL
jgi:tRNA threonylcarbamoyladenosine biosynthesis protein TsaB